MNDENRTTLLVLGAVVIGIVLGIFLAQQVSGDIRAVSSDIKSLQASLNGVESSIKGVDSSVKDIKTTLAEKDKVSFRRDMQENGRRMLSLDYAGKFTKWDTAKSEIEELDKALQDAAILDSQLSAAIQDFRNMYIPKLKDAVSKKDTKNFESVWAETYNACIGCHKGAGSPPSAIETLREISSEVEQLAG
ncbi:hypothetical protein [Candidatus Methanoperedens nitratireducens]|uniref:Uncharacterized protein n=1 Tax=Candidatus Methanoperedens nitratireducens TaxID=1392998 RepID=A0A284VQX8_9EURY|nr:hypothetical protein [Candidatus Methanoperedens nitroreducens]SNQ61603.1 hypothetical protein MNV_410010 [Candidatus Methanoperedens nitroreducens]